MNHFPKEISIGAEPDIGEVVAEPTEWADRESELQEERPDEFVSPEAV